MKPKRKKTRPLKRLNHEEERKKKSTEENRIVFAGVCQVALKPGRTIFMPKSPEKAPSDNDGAESIYEKGDQIK